jgi:hypothetical protein
VPEFLLEEVAKQSGFKLDQKALIATISELADYDAIIFGPGTRRQASNAVIGARMPNSVVTAPVTAKAINDVPALKPYTFSMVQKKIVIVNPTDHKIATVIAEAP